MIGPEVLKAFGKTNISMPCKLGPTPLFKIATKTRLTGAYLSAITTLLSNCAAAAGCYFPTRV
jgi:hypothetical protein